MSWPNSIVIYVVVGVIFNSKNEVLISKRSKQTSEGGLWEFPGGKIEGGETIFETLKRELNEEMNIEVVEQKPFMNVQYAYPSYCVNLQVCLVEQYRGAPQSKEGQAIRWVRIASLYQVEFPAANKMIVAELMAKFS